MTIIGSPEREVFKNPNLHNYTLKAVANDRSLSGRNVFTIPRQMHGVTAISSAAIFSALGRRRCRPATLGFKTGVR
jgi:hypothetical protein